jgi:hypothetical protein
VGGAAVEGEQMSHVLEKVKEEFFAILLPTVFFFVSLHIVAVIRALMARGTAYTPLSTFAIAISALILGKAVLIADLLPAINRFPDRPLAYNVMWKTGIFLLFATALHFGERWLEFARESHSATLGWDEMAAQIVWPHFWAIEILLFVLILLYCTARELVRVLGRERVTRIFFGPLPLPKF